MNAIKSSLLLLLLAACSSKDPKTLAQEYCDCFHEGLTNPERMNECAELAAEHREKLAKDPETARIYGESIIRCAVYDQNLNQR